MYAVVAGANNSIMDFEEVRITTSLQSFLTKAWETIATHAWSLELCKYTRKSNRPLRLQIYCDRKRILSIKPWLFVTSQIHVYIDFWMCEMADLSAILGSMRDTDTARIRKMTIDGEIDDIIKNLAFVNTRCKSIAALCLSIYTGYGYEDATRITLNILALRKLRELSCERQTLVVTYTNIYNVSALKAFSTLHQRGKNSDSPKYLLSVLRNVNALCIQYSGGDTFAEDSCLFAQLKELSIVVFSEDPPMMQEAISTMPVLKKLELNGVVFEWHNLAAACPRLRILLLQICDITGTCDDTHALCLMKLSMISVRWYCRNPNTSSCIRQMTSSVLEELTVMCATRLSYLMGIGACASERNLLSVTSDKNELCKLMDDARLVMNCEVSIVTGMFSHLKKSSLFKTARYERIRLFLYRHTL